MNVLTSNTKIILMGAENTIDSDQCPKSYAADFANPDTAVCTSILTTVNFPTDDVLPSKKEVIENTDNTGSFGISNANKNVDAWIPIILILSGLFRSLKFGEPYLTEFLVVSKKLTENQVNNDVYNYWTYSYLLFMLPMSLLSSRISFYYLILMQLFGEILTYGLIIWGVGLRTMRFMQVVYGFSTACSVGYLCAVVSLFPKHLIHKWNGFLRASLLIGHVIASVSGQVMVWAKVSLHWLFICSFISLIISLIVSFRIPMTPSQIKSLNASLDKDDTLTFRDNADSTDLTSTNSLNLFDIISSWWVYLKNQFASSYPSFSVVYLGIIWSFLYCFLLIGESYGSSFWFFIRNEKNHKFGQWVDQNGLMDAFGRLAGACASILIGHLDLRDSFISNYQNFSMFVFILISVFGGGYGSLILFSNILPNQWILSIIWVITIGAGYALTSLLTGYLALQVPNENYGFLLSSLLFLSLFWQSLYQLVCSHDVINISIKWKYLSLSILTMSISVIFLFYFLVNKSKNQILP